jgi:hypothetical protein
MKPADARDARYPSTWLLFGLIALLPLMNPPVFYPVILADLVFVLLALALGVELLSGRRKLRWDPCSVVLGAYAISLTPSLIATSDLPLSLFKLATEGFLVGLTIFTVMVVTDAALFRRAVTTWLLATAAMCAVGLAGLIAFAVDPHALIYQYTSFDFGTLPPGHYPRLDLTFLNANMACNYLTVSVGLLFMAWSEGWLKKPQALALLAAFLIAAAFTISPGLGGIALAVGSSFFILRGSGLALLLGIGTALAFLVAVWFTLIPHSTATFEVHLPRTSAILEPSGRFLTGQPPGANWPPTLWSAMASASAPSSSVMPTLLGISSN